MNTSELEVLLSEIEFLYNDRLAADAAHFKPGVVGGIVQRTPDLINQVRRLMAAAKQEKRDAYYAGQANQASSYEQWAAIVPPPLDTGADET